MSDRFYQLVEHASKSYSRFTLAAMAILTITVTGTVLHFISLEFTSLLPHSWKNYLLLAEKMTVLTLLFLMMWYYHKSRHLLHDHAIRENQLQVFIKYTPAAVAMIDKEMKYIAASDRWLQNFHIKEKDITGKSHYDIFSGLVDMERWKKDHNACLNGNSIHCDEDHFIGLDGREEWLTYDILPWYDMNNKVAGLIFLVEFITERIHAVQKLQQSEARFARILRGTNDGIFDWNVQENTVYFSPRFKTYLGYTENEVDNSYEGFNSLLHPDDIAHTRKKVDDHLLYNKPYEVEYRLRRKNGSYVWIEARGQTEWSSDGRPTYFSGTMVDISERKRLEELRKEFVYVVTHELRTPLSVLRGALDMLPHLLNESLPDKAEKSLDLALQGCDRLTLLVNDLLEAGKAETDQIAFNMQPCAIRPLLESALALNKIYGDKFNIAYVLEDVPDCRVMLDDNRFLQIMVNLLSNAAKFSPSDMVVIVSANIINHRLVISVKDFGAGIPQDFRSKIFQKFARGHNDIPGTGLGLNITKTMVEKMNGEVWFETESGKGTTFFVAFQLA